MCRSTDKALIDMSSSRPRRAIVDDETVGALIDLLA
jgi:hypothetical protein